MATETVKLNQVHSRLDWLLRRGEKAFQEAVQKWFSFTIKQIQEDLRSKFQKDVASELTDWEFLQERGEEILKPATLSIMQSGGQEAYKLLQVKGAFDILNTEAVGAANKFCADLVRQVNQETKEGIRNYISAGIKEGKSMDKIARELRPIVGLTGRQSESIVNYRTLLSDKEKFPRLTAADIDRKTQKYADKTHRRRTQTIARTETARAQNIGYAAGVSDLGIEQLEFSAYTGCCDKCDAMDGEKYPVNEAKDIIPVHPNCRCAMLPVIAGEGVDSVTSAMEKLPEHVEDLLNRLDKATDKREQQRIRRSLRKLGHKGGLRTKLPTGETVVTPPEVAGLGAKTVGKAEARIARTLDIDRRAVSLTGLQLETANAVSKGVYDFKRKFPQLKIDAVKVGAAHKNIYAEIETQWRTSRTTLILHQKEFSNHKKLVRAMKTNGRTGYLVGDSIADTIAHECGHALSYVHLSKKYGGKAYMEVNRLRSIKFDAKGLSRYGSKDGAEGLAEVFSKYVKTGSLKGITIGGRADIEGIKRIMKTYAGVEL